MAQELNFIPPEEAEKLLSQVGDISDKVSDTLEDVASQPAASQYDSTKDPEMHPEILIGEELAECVEKSEAALREAGERLSNMVKRYAQSKNYNPKEMSFEDFIDSDFIDRERAEWIMHNPTTEEDARRKYNKAIIGMGGSAGMSVMTSQFDDDEDEDMSEEEMADRVANLSDSAKRLMAKYEDAETSALSVEDTVESKYDFVYETVRKILTGQSFKKHAFICGDAGVGKSYSVNKCIEDNWDTSPLKKSGFTLTTSKGSIGTSLSSIVAYFYQHKDKEIIILDDADGFLKTGGIDVMNMLKGMLDSDNTMAHPTPIMTPPTIRKMAGKFVAQSRRARESATTISFDKKLLRESNYLELKVNDKVVFSESVTPEDAELLCGAETSRVRESNGTKISTNIFGNYRKFTEALDEVPEDVQDYVDAQGCSLEEAFEDLGYSLDEYADLVANDQMLDTEDADDIGKNGLPETFEFTSRLIMISNLAPNSVDEAFRTRCDVVALTLTHEEFAAHLKVILPGMMQDLETTTDYAITEKIRDTVYGYLCSLIELEGMSMFGKRVVINLPLQFRLIPEFAGTFLTLANQYCRKYKLQLTAETIPTIAIGIEPVLIPNYMMPTLADNQYQGDPNKRRRR